MAELDWFPLYWQRFLLGTRDFTTEEVGAYFLLLLHEWDKGFLPENDKELKKISGISVKKLQNVLKKFKKIDGKLYNSALEIIRIEQSEKAAKYSKRGTNAAEARWNKQCISNAQASDKQCLDDAIREEEIREEKKREEEILPKVKKDFTSKKIEPPTLNEVELFVQSEGFPREFAEKIFKYYADADWHDSKGNKVKNWKQKIRGNWLKPENKNYGKQQPTNQSKPTLGRNATDYELAAAVAKLNGVDLDGSQNFTGGNQGE